MEFKIGDRVELIKMSDDPLPIEVGSRGTITRTNEQEEFTQITVDWEKE